jgi:hypothetical protein
VVPIRFANSAWLSGGTEVVLCLVNCFVTLLAAVSSKISSSLFDLVSSSEWGFDLRRTSALIGWADDEFEADPPYVPPLPDVFLSGLSAPIHPALLFSCRLSSGL